jgi:uncharacterized protein (TIGR02302 family)
MTNSSPRTLSQPGWRIDQTARIGRLIAVARGAIAAERVLPALWPALGCAGLYLTLALIGLLALIPWPLQALLLAATITATGLALESGFRGVRLPRWEDGARRLERDSGLKHRPISESGDRLIGDDPLARELWRLHLARPLPLKDLRVAWPAPDLTRRDPRNFRYLVLVVLAVSLVAARSDWRARLIQAFDSGAGLNLSVDAWLDPPAYTGLPPIYLTRGEQAMISAPAGSVLNVRVHGGTHAPGLSLGQPNPPRFQGADGEYSANARLARDSHVRVRANGHVIGNWTVHAIPDAVPVIAFTARPAATEHQATEFKFRASDDYGVTGVRAVIRPHGRGGKPLNVELPLAQGSAKSLTQTSYSDLTAHPYAGLTVDAVLEARDGAGQIGRSAPITFRLPARVFTDPLARALIEQRQNLATGGRTERRLVAEALDALTLAPDKFYDGKNSLYLSLRAAYWGARSARSDSDIAHVEDLLWQIAVAIDHGVMLAAADEMRKLQAMINAALAAHAPQEVIDALLQRYNQAMQRYMQALANDPSAQKPQQMQSGSETKNITEEDIQKLMQTIQQLAASGNREMAAQMLAMLQSMMENLHLVRGAGGGGAGQDKALNQTIQKFGEMMGQQRGLMDKTMRQRQGNGDPKDGGVAGLMRQQGALRKQLDEALKGLDPKLKDALGQAGKAMDNAQRALAQQNLDNAGNEQKNALEALRKGADALAAMQNAQNQKPDGEDPLGRSRGANSGFKLPGLSDMARAKAILQELRKRAGERGRSQQELDYIDRLLREF